MSSLMHWHMWATPLAAGPRLSHGKSTRRAVTVVSFTDYRLSSLEGPSHLRDIRFGQMGPFILVRKLIKKKETANPDQAWRGLGSARLYLPMIRHMLQHPWRPNGHWPRYRCRCNVNRCSLNKEGMLFLLALPLPYAICFLNTYPLQEQGEQVLLRKLHGHLTSFPSGKDLCLHSPEPNDYGLRRKSLRGAVWLQTKVQHRGHDICRQTGAAEVLWTEQGPLPCPYRSMGRPLSSSAPPVLDSALAVWVFRATRESIDDHTTRSLLWTRRTTTIDLSDLSQATLINWVDSAIWFP